MSIPERLCGYGHAFRYIPPMNRAHGTFPATARRVVLGLLLSCHFRGLAAESLSWQKDRDSVDADIRSWSLVRTLETIAEATGWQIYLEPGTRRTVSTKFK